MLKIENDIIQKTVDSLVQRIADDTVGEPVVDLSSGYIGTIEGVALIPQYLENETSKEIGRYLYLINYHEKGYTYQMENEFLIIEGIPEMALGLIHDKLDGLS